MIVALTNTELLMAATTGIARRIDSLAHQRAQTVPGIDAKGMGWVRDIEGACAELAVAKATNRFYDFSQRRFRGQGGDVDAWQVRHTVEDEGHLILREHDDRNAYYMLVTGHSGTYTIRGYLLGEDGRKDEWKRDPGGRGRPCWFIPQSALLVLTWRRDRSLAA